MAIATVEKDPPTEHPGQIDILDIGDVRARRYPSRLLQEDGTEIPVPRYELEVQSMIDNRWHWVTLSSAQLWRLWTEIGSALGYEPGVPLSSLERR